MRIARFAYQAGASLLKNPRVGKTIRPAVTTEQEIDMHTVEEAREKCLPLRTNGKHNADNYTKYGFKCVDCGETVYRGAYGNRPGRYLMREAAREAAAEHFKRCGLAGAPQ